MTPNEYQKLAMRTCSIPYDRDLMEETFPSVHTRGMVLHAALEINSEAGEVAGIAQKVYQGHDFNVDHMKKELGDILWGIAEMTTALGLSMDEIMWCNIDKLRKRYPDSFEPKKSLHRSENDF